MRIWTKKEIKYLREYYPSYEKEKLMELLKERTWRAISGKAQRLGIKCEMSLTYEKMRRKRKMINPNLVGQAGERAAKSYLVKEGITVELFDECGRKHYDSGWIKWCSSCIRDSENSDCTRGKKWKEFIEWVSNMINTRPEEERRIPYDLDLYGEHGDVRYVIEVKANDGRLRWGQKQTLILAEELGYVPMVIYTKVNKRYKGKVECVEVMQEGELRKQR